MTLSVSISTFVTAALTVTGTIAGVVVGQRLQARARRIELDLSNSKELMAYKIKLLERITLAMVKFARAEIITKMLNIDRIRFDPEVIMKIVEASAGLSPDYLKGGLGTLVHLDLNKELIDIQAEFNGVSNLCILYFGETTRAAIHKAAKVEPWHALDEKVRQDIVDSMAAEIRSAS